MQPSGIIRNTRYSAYTRSKERGTLYLGQQHSFFLFLFLFLFGRSGHFYSSVFRVSSCVRVQVGILEFFCLGPPPPPPWMWIDMDMDQVWSIFFINFFSALVGVEIAFLFLFFFFLWAGGEVSWTCSLFFLISRRLLLLVCIVGRRGKERKEREKLAGVERSRMDQGTE